MTFSLRLSLDRFNKVNKPVGYGPFGWSPDSGRQAVS